MPSIRKSTVQSSTGNLDGGDEMLCLLVSCIWLNQIDQTNQMDRIDRARPAACIRRP